MARLDATGGASAAPTKAMKCCAGFAECKTKKNAHRTSPTKSGKCGAEFRIEI